MHILASPGYTPGTIVVNVTWMKNRIQCLSIKPVSSKVRHFSTFWPPWVRPWENRGKFTWMERGFNAGQTHSSIYPSIFNRLRAIARYWSEKLQLFPTSLAFNALVRRWRYSHWKSGKMFGPQKTRIMGYQAVKTV